MGSEGQASRDAIRDVVRDLRRQSWANGLLLTGFIVAVIVAARWLNGGPYAGNSIYLVLVLTVVAIRGADLQFARSVARLAAILEADRERQARRAS